MGWQSPNKIVTFILISLLNCFSFVFQTMQDVLRVNASSDLTVEWNFLEKDLPGVVLHDRLMTDAALGHRPIKSEHSYSLNSDGDSLPDSPISSHKMDGKNLFTLMQIQNV